MKKIPFIGTKYNLIVTLAIAVVGILSLFTRAKYAFAKLTKGNISFEECKSEDS